MNAFDRFVSLGLCRFGTIASNRCRRRQLASGAALVVFVRFQTFSGRGIQRRVVFPMDGAARLRRATSKFAPQGFRRAVIILARKIDFPHKLFRRRSSALMFRRTATDANSISAPIVSSGSLLSCLSKFLVLLYSCTV